MAERTLGWSILRYAGRFTLVHVLAYALVGTLFVSLAAGLPAADRAALDFFEPYRAPALVVLVAQALRGVVLALVLAPFSDAILRRDRGWLAYFGATWGLTTVGSIEPMPGSVEGVLYTVTPPTAHLVVLAATAAEFALFSWVFVRWERRVGAGTVETGPDSCGGQPSRSDGRGRATFLVGYFARFALLYAVAYLVAGLAFMRLQDYGTVLATRAAFELYRPLSDPLVAAAPVVQLLRGGLLALFVLPFATRFLRDGRGWLLLFGGLWGGTFLGAPNAVQELLTDLASGGVGNVLFGTAEVTVQMALFAVLFWGWERRSVVAEGQSPAG